MPASPPPLRAAGAATLLAALAVPATASPAPRVPPTFRAAQLSEAASALLHAGPAPTVESLQQDALRARRRAVLRRLAARQARWDRTRGHRVRSVLVRLRRAGDRIATRPYAYGGGHGSFQAAGYDCSGSVSYVLHGAGLLSRPLASGDFTAYGEPGPGRHVTVYANGGHAFMVIDGRRYDTSAMSQSGGSRWATAPRSSAGYVARHPAGL
jgi:cell wall-associated NlpC family hydrolase